MAKKSAKKSKTDYWSCPKTTKAFEIALYYGFVPQEPVAIEKIDREHAKNFISEGHMFVDPAEKSALIRKWFKDSVPSSPVMFASTRDNYSLDIIGTNQGIADATLLKVLYETVKSEGYEDISLELNSVGDRESFARYSKDLGNYHRKHASTLHVDCRQIFKKNPYTTLVCQHAECKEAYVKTPYSMNYLSEPSRTYFMELLELLEKTDIPYNLNNALVANPEFAIHTIFRITANIGEKKNEIVAYGSRWGLIAKKSGFKKDIQGVSGTVRIGRLKKTKEQMKIQKPKCYFIQMGQEAKYKSLSVIETLRQSKISVYHSLTKDKFTAQLMSAENLKVPYIIIMGQKESVENTVLVREMENRCQETIRVEHIASYLRKMMR